jgi:uncharacterized coiled-coil protein SlyX
VSHEDRFVDIEIKLAHQEDLVESLNPLLNTPRSTRAKPVSRNANMQMRLA